jgi:dimethylamine monooxygenase subunit A
MRQSIGRPPARYTPFENGMYKIEHGLVPFGTDCGQPAIDHHVFQLDCLFDDYRSKKLFDVQTARDKHICVKTDLLSSQVASAATKFIVRRLLDEHPETFDILDIGTTHVLKCLHSDETIVFDSNWQLEPRQQNGQPDGGTASALNALSLQIQEDIAIVCRHGTSNSLAYLNVSFPSGWKPDQKLGQPFPIVHGPVPKEKFFVGGEQRFVAMMIEATEGLVRFAWGVQTDSELNHYSPPPVLDSLDDDGGPGFVRVERQTMWGFPDVNVSLFTIRLYLLPFDEFRSDGTLWDPFCNAIESMSDERILEYKGLTRWKKAFLDKVRPRRDGDVQAPPSLSR